MNKAAGIFFFVSVIVLTYTVTIRTLDYRQVEERVAYRETVEAKASQELANIKKLEIPELITNLYHEDGRYIRVGEPLIISATISILQMLIIQEAAEGSVLNDMVEHINRALEPPPVMGHQEDDVMSHIRPDLREHIERALESAPLKLHPLFNRY